MSKEMAKGLYVGDKFSLTNGDEKKTYVVKERNDDVDDGPEYTFENVETGEIHEPVLWQWLDRDDLELTI